MRHLFKNIANLNYVRPVMVLSIDIVLSVIASFVSMLLSEYVLALNTSFIYLIRALLMSLVGSFIAFILFKTYKHIIRYTSVVDYFVLALASVVKVLIAFSLFYIIFPELFNKKATYLNVTFEILLTIVLLCFFRISVVMFFNYIKRGNKGSECERVLIYGTSEKSVSLSDRLLTSTHYEIVGYILCGENIANYLIGDTKVNFFKDETSFKKIIFDNSVSAIIFTLHDDMHAEQNQLVKYALDMDVKILFAPPIEKVANGTLPLSIHDVKIEDLLGRDEISISIDVITKDLNNKVVMVTGAAGSIGSELCRQLAKFDIRKLILFDNAETPMHNLRLELEEKFPNLSFVPIIGDVRLLARLDFAFREHQPNVVFHAAAYKHVPLMEENPCEAVLVNVIGSRNVADKCVEYGAEKMVMVSTDKAVDPTNVMGCTKRLAEIYVQSLGLWLNENKESNIHKPKFITTRFGNVLGSNGSVIPRFREQIAKGGPVTVTHKEITRYFMTIPEACRLVLEASNISQGNEILVFDMGEPVKIADLATKMIKLAGLEPDKDIKIEYVGLRPGEKMYEVLLSNEENTSPTVHDRIRIAKVRWYEYEEAKSCVMELEQLSRAVDIPSTVKLMKKIVTEYKSSNSRFEEFDK